MNMILTVMLAFMPAACPVKQFPTFMGQAKENLPVSINDLRKAPPEVVLDRRSLSLSSGPEAIGKKTYFYRSASGLMAQFFLDDDGFLSSVTILCSDPSKAVTLTFQPHLTMSTRQPYKRLRRTGISVPLIDNLPLARLSPGR